MNDHVYQEYEDILEDWKRKNGRKPEMSELKMGELKMGEPEMGEPETASGIDALYSLTLETKELQRRLSERVFGQEKAVSSFVTGYFQARVTDMTEPDRVKPRATFLFAGEPGVGKTFLAETAAELLGLPYARFDMSEYSDRESMLEFSGSDKVYTNGGEGNLTAFVRKHPQCVLLFDEIEKAHLNVIHLFLQMLDAGRLRDNYTDKEISFKDAILIFTTNAGRQLYEDPRSRNLSEISRKTIIRALQTDMKPGTEIPLFPSALCSRFASGNVILFNHMEAHHLKHIACGVLNRCAASLMSRFGLRVEIDDNVSSALLFSEGGSADARTVAGRAESFFNEELFELFRQLALFEEPSRMARLERIHFTVDLTDAREEARKLFEPGQKQTVLVFAEEKTVAAIAAGEVEFENCRLLATASADRAMEILRREEIWALFIETALKGPRDAAAYLNMEDINSEYVNLYEDVREQMPDMPVYILKTEQTRLRREEELSFLRSGARDIFDQTKQSLGEILAGIGDSLHQQRAMDELARYHQVLSYGSGQILSKDGREAQIAIIDLELKYAVEAGDSEKLLSAATRPDIHFKDIIGADDVKEELRFYVDYLKNPRGYMNKGLRAPRGILLYGSPGTGKTMLAKAMAAEANMTFLTASGSQFLKKHVGEGARAVHELFETARKYAPAIIFIDEIDAVGRKRENDGDGNAHGEALNAILTEMDGFQNAAREMVFVLAATNYGVDGHGSRTLDAALVRRFDRQIRVGLPGRTERRQFLRMRRDGNPALAFSGDMLEHLVVRSTGMSLASLDSVLELSLRDTFRLREAAVTDEILLEAFETFHNGSERQWNEKELLRRARHEAGHAFICLDQGHVPAYLTIAARDARGGYMFQEQAEDKGCWTRQELLEQIRIALGGRAAEIVCYGPGEGLSTGASDDLRKATALARYMLCECGMDAEMGMAVRSNGYFGCDAADGAMSREVLLKTNEILETELQKAMETIAARRPVLDRLAEALLKDTHLDEKRIEAVFKNN